MRAGRSPRPGRRVSLGLSIGGGQGQWLVPLLGDPQVLEAPLATPLLLCSRVPLDMPLSPSLLVFLVEKCSKGIAWGDCGATGCVGEGMAAAAPCVPFPVCLRTWEVLRPGPCSQAPPCLSTPPGPPGLAAVCTAPPTCLTCTSSGPSYPSPLRTPWEQLPARHRPARDRKSVV